MWLVISTFLFSKTFFYVCEVLISKLYWDTRGIYHTKYNWFLTYSYYRRDSGPHEEAEKCMKILRDRKLTVANIANMLSNITTKDEEINR